MPSSFVLKLRYGTDLSADDYAALEGEARDTLRVGTHRDLVWKSNIAVDGQCGAPGAMTRAAMNSLI